MGMLIRLALIGLAIWLGVALLRALRRSISPENRNPSPPPAGQERSGDAYQPMVRCSGCGVHLPQQAVSAQGLCGKCLKKMSDE